VPQNERERHDAGDALRDVEPVLAERVLGHVGLRLAEQHHAVTCVEQERQHDGDELDQRERRDLLDVIDRVVEGLLPAERARVRPQVLDEERADGHDARERVELPEEKAVAGPRHGKNATLYHRSLMILHADAIDA